MIVDFHSHTRHSDGELTTSQLLEFACTNRVDVFSVTDHDSLAAYDDLNGDQPLVIIPGVEISCQLEGKELHVVGLGVGLENDKLNHLLENNRAVRKERAQWIIERLIKLNYPDITDSLNHITTGDVVCRTHLAKSLVEVGIVKDFQAAFKRYLGRTGKVWRRAEWPDLTNVIKTIQQAGGAAILAHPTKYRYSSGKLSMIVENFANLGGDAIEINYSGLNLNHKAWLKRLALKHDLKVSVGSDFHHSKQTWAKPGHFSQIDSELKPVWQQFLV